MSPNRQQLLNSIRPGMKLCQSFFLRIYGYEISYPGFADEAIKVLEGAGCSKAKSYYNEIIAKYQKKRDEELKPAARQIKKQWEMDWQKLVKEGEEKRKQETQIQSLTEKELSVLCEKLLQEGIITRPEQFVTVAGLDL